MKDSNIDLTDSEWAEISKLNHRTDLALYHLTEMTKKAFISIKDLENAGIDTDKLKQGLRDILGD